MVKQFEAFQVVLGRELKIGTFDTEKAAEKAIEQTLKKSPDYDCRIRTVYRNRRREDPSDML